MWRVPRDGEATRALYIFIESANINISRKLGEFFLVSKVYVQFREKTWPLSLVLCLHVCRVGRGSLRLAVGMLRRNVQEAVGGTRSFAVAEFGDKSCLGHLMSELEQTV